VKPLAIICLVGLTACGPEWHDGNPATNETEAFVGSGLVATSLFCLMAAYAAAPACF
jgi:hypothetical protein